jgi:hypothetical protein
MHQFLLAINNASSPLTIIKIHQFLFTMLIANNNWVLMTANGDDALLIVNKK